MEQFDMMYPSIDIRCDTQEQADRLIELFNEVSDEFEGQRCCDEIKFKMQNRMRSIQYKLYIDDFFEGVSFKLMGGFAFNEDTWCLEDIITYHQVYCPDNQTDYEKPDYVQVNNMLFDLKANGILQSYTPVMPCLNTILPRYEKPYPKDKTITVEVRYDAQDEIKEEDMRLFKIILPKKIRK